jgi:hypothetical protein
VEQTQRRYIRAYELLTGKSFEEYKANAGL